ncbi:MAG: hypothetical protein A3C93_01420 [Candidatus Lloydbacteria bacterium RIFCSPHIGHO2_02_FULL_54_17]|uniref:Peptidoglycan binding-like domain-containing protein n=1 Tax=Candidatus Lloydbacteria bacterium RIFCSPHIGHO2_02_FULL_54_17 TaxID=1798664 RepID=A0A1G2DDG5_9BACT|nr:MAG: hypothetical protein A2762_00345 [Candidatus Lloydbacteria bacterium RIFCSPHIGHO2_01_FULL_54_11]OGZ10991.1 MAG: hypothetical protein A3C93_01420 [Candidatus Lloydbacteria bacterium RIFCSPHIGHO2_02_FULL_54_17]OGZ13142.1 MAG: hypothetical protein A2948_02115 [Candidatus Lloydbacteria bacterium RIFCSPLOWO2_01_FULL_54_18]OGZ14861.1 MAG: hypothetical protein A3H76_06240 [Candidatus Lloydbacteria bacterium RIFCSPLOWO2_02_FULL_54_12]
MTNFKKSKTSKVVSGFVGLATALMMMGPAVASAATVEELTAQIAALMAQVQALQGATSAPVAAPAHVFSVDLTVGSKGDDVTALQTILVAKGFLTMPAGVAMGYFGNLTKVAVAAWQAAEGISPAAGYFGPKSRAAMNAMTPAPTTTTTTTPETTTTTTTTTTTSTVAGCTGTTGFSPTTGQSCAVTSLPTGCTTNVGYSPVTGLSCAATAETTTTSGGLTATLDVTSPASGTLITGQAVATLAVFKVTNASAAAAKITVLKFKRIGISSDSTLTNVYLYSGSTRLTDSAAVAQSIVNFNDSAGLVTVPAGGSVLLAIRADIAADMNGQNVGIMLTDVTSDAGTVGGLPVSGAQHEIAALPVGATTVDFTNVTVQPAADSNVDPQTDFRAWQKTITINNRDAVMSSFRLRQIGSISTGDLKNFRLLIDGVAVGTAVDTVDSGGYVTWTFATPITLKSGGRDFKVLADIVGGSNRTFQLSLRQAGDIEIADSQLGFTVLPVVGAAAFSAMTTGIQTINQGTLSIAKATDSLSGNVVNQGSGITLGKFTMKAQGEKLKVEYLRVSFTPHAAEAGGIAATDLTKLRNGALFANGVQIGSTADICADDASAGACAADYTQYNLGSALVLEPGKDVTLEVRGDVFDNDGTNQMSANDTFTVNLVLGVTNVQRMTSLSYIANSAVSANQLTVAAGTLTLAKYTAFANQTITVPQTAYKIGEFRLTSGSTEAVNLTGFALDFTNTAPSASVLLITDVYIVYGGKTSQVKSTVATSSNTWSLNETMAVNSDMPIAVYATLGSTIDSARTIITELTVQGNSVNSGSSANSAEVAGQTVTVGAGTLSTALDASTPGIANVVGNSEPKIASFKYNSLNDSFTLKEIGVTVGSAGAAAIVELVFKDGATELKRVPVNVTAATATGLSVVVPYNGSKIIDVYAKLGTIGTGYATTSSNVAVALSSTKYMNSTGSTLWENTAQQGNATYVFKTKPTITNVALPTTVFAAGTVTVAKFTITADAGGTIAWRKLILTTATSSTGATYYVTAYGLFDDSGSQIASITSNGSLTASQAGAITFESTADQEISGSKTYVVKATITGSPTTASLSHYIAYAAIYAAQAAYSNASGVSTNNFVWSDESIVGHSDTTNDWMGDYKVKNLPSDYQTLTK